MTAVLEVRDVSVRFGGVRALEEVSMSAEAGAITGVIGPNGAGKTTLFNVVSGLIRPNAGRVHLAGADITGTGPTKRARLGLARTFQRLELFGMLTVRENVLVAIEARHRRNSFADRLQSADELLTRVRLGSLADERATRLSTGQGRLVELARALACDPSVLLLDEPASGQDESETEQFAATLRQLADSGIAVVLVEHDMSLVMSVCDRVHVFDAGRELAEGTPAEIARDPAVVDAYLGTGAVI